MVDHDSLNTSARMALEALGDLAYLLMDEAVVEISANPDGSVFCDKFGSGWEQIGKIDARERTKFARVCASETGDQIGESRPIYSGRVPGTAHRVEILVPPAVSEPSFSIRRHRSIRLGLDDFDIEADTKAQLVKALKSRSNVVIAAGTKAGKTSFTNACLNEIASFEPDTRAIIIEDTDELNSPFSNTVKLRAGTHAGFDTLLASTLRLAPTRIFLGEVRTGEQALALLKAWNTGHPGGLTTIHADSAKEVAARFSELLGEVSQAEQSELVGRAIDGIVFLERGKSKPRVAEFILNSKSPTASLS